MKNYLVIVALAFVPLSQAANQSILTGIEILSTHDEGGQSPFEILEKLFNEATPLAYSALPDARKKREIEAWTCTGGDSTMTVESMKVLPSVPSKVKFHFVSEPAKAAIPGRGPLFPGTPAQPEKIAKIDSIAYFAKGSFSDTPSIECSQCLAFKRELQLEPELVQRALMSATDEGSWLTTTYRGKDGLILFREELSAYADNTAQINFYYCWK